MNCLKSKHDNDAHVKSSKDCTSTWRWNACNTDFWTILNPYTLTLVFWHGHIRKLIKSERRFKFCSDMKSDVNCSNFGSIRLCFDTIFAFASQKNHFNIVSINAKWQTVQINLILLQKGGLLTSSTKLPFQIDTYESQTYVDKFSAVNTCDVFESFN